MSKDYYKILGVSKNATPEEIKRAYRGLAHQYHPDKTGGSEEKFKEINEAYQVLGDSKKRAQYDQFGSTFENMRGQGGFSGFQDFRDFSAFSEAFQNGNFGGFSGSFTDFGDIFSDFFGGASQRRAVKKGNDISIDIEVTLEEILNGARREVEINKKNLCKNCGGSGGEPYSKMETCGICQGMGRVTQQQRIFFGTVLRESVCDKCGGQGKMPEKICANCRGEGVKKSPDRISIDIPAGVENGMTLRIEQKGEAIRGGVAGDLYAQIHVKPHKLFKRDGADLYYTLPLRFTQLIRGDKVEVPTLDGNINLKIPAGIEAGRMLQLKDKGLPYFQRSGRGDMYVKIDVVIPKKLSKKARELLRELDKEIND